MITIKLITEPRICLVGHQTVDFDALGSYLSDEGYPEWYTDTDVSSEVLVELAGRNCYQSFKIGRPGGNKAYIDNILQSGHGSVLEHAAWSFLISGVSRSLSHELVRHRHNSISQLSQRYVDESDVAFVVPPAIRIRPGEKIFLGSYSDEQFESRQDFSAFCCWHQSIYDARRAYIILSQALSEKYAESISDSTLRRKTIREAARSVLPNCTETKIFITGNARGWRHFLELRGSRFADAEIRRLAIQVLTVLKSKSPHLFGDYRLVDFEERNPEIVTDYRGV